MKKHQFGLTALALTVLFSGASIQAAEPDSADSRLRDALRDTTAQLRTAEADKAKLQASQSALADENKALSAQVDALRKQMNVDKDTTDAELEKLKERITNHEEEAARLKEELMEAKQKVEAMTAVIQDRDAELGKLKAACTALEQVAAESQRKNVSLYKIANEILTRYEKFSLGEALKAKEPFVGTTRVKLENLVQEYQDKLLNEKLVP